MNIGFTGHRNRTWDETFLVELATKYPDAMWVHGGAIGFDTFVESIAEKHNIKTFVIRPDYAHYPTKQAPIIRNYQIVDMSEVMIAGFDGREYGGTIRTMNYARFRQKKVIELAPDTVYHVEGLI